MKTRQNAVYSVNGFSGRPVIFADRSWPDLEYSSTNFCRFLVLICNSRESFRAGFHRRAQLRYLGRCGWEFNAGLDSLRNLVEQIS